MYLVVRRLNGVEKPVGKAPTGKLANILADCLRYRRPKWEIGVVWNDNPPAYDPWDAVRMDAN